MELRRHDLLDIDDEGRRKILDELTESESIRSFDAHRYARILLPDQAECRVPGVVRREEQAPRNGLIPVGFSSPVADKEGRFRIAAFVHPHNVIGITSPYEVLASANLKPRNACTKALDITKSHAQALNLFLGVWGSVALELYTGLPCTHQNSDLDLLVKPASHEVLARFLTEITSIEKRFGMRIDVELDLPDGYGVQLKELFGSRQTVLGKGTKEVALLVKEKVFAGLPQKTQSLPLHVAVGNQEQLYGCRHSN